MTDLGALAGSFSFAGNISAEGHIVGASQVTGDPDLHAFLWRNEGEGMLDLNNLIPADSGWILAVAFGINAKGQIVGGGLLAGQRRGFLLTPA